MVERKNYGDAPSQFERPFSLSFPSGENWKEPERAPSSEVVGGAGAEPHHRLASRSRVIFHRRVSSVWRIALSSTVIRIRTCRNLRHSEKDFTFFSLLTKKLDV